MASIRHMDTMHSWCISFEYFILTSSTDLWSLKELAQYRCVVSFSRLLGRLTIAKAPNGHFCRNEKPLVQIYCFFLIHYSLTGSQNSEAVRLIKLFCTQSCSQASSHNFTYLNADSASYTEWFSYPYYFALCGDLYTQFACKELFTVRPESSGYCINISGVTVHRDMMHCNVKVCIREMCKKKCSILLIRHLMQLKC